ncbi:TIGR00266 family protein [Kitasatospora sp. NPDC101176]|uniref:TIGR00266 family protein n=1 Tax=Kitasatospora sp. NPDC101176 TaxID=3364099 RepID=UPI0037F5FC26
MHVETRHQPGFAVARCVLAAGESLVGQSGSMYRSSPGLEIEAMAQGGVLASLKRAALGGSSLFLTRYTAQSAQGWVDLVHQLPGDVAGLEVTADHPVQVTQGNWLGCSSGVAPQTKWAGMQNLLGGEGGFVLRMEGAGTVVLGCYGALDAVELGPGEQLTVAAGHIVGYDADVTLAVRRMARGRTIRSLKTGQFLVCDLTGPGRVLLQTRSPNEMVSYIQENLPKPAAPGNDGGQND